MAEPKPTPFAVRMQQARDELGLSAAAAARRSNVSQARYAQVERGYETRGEVKVAAKPSREFVLKVAAGLNIPRAEALSLAGFPVDTTEEQPGTTPPTRIWETWTKLTKQQQQCLEWLSRLMVDPHAVYDAEPTKADHRARFVPPTETSSRSRT